MRAAVLGGLVLAVAAASAGHAQEASLTLVCSGSDATPVAMPSYGWTGRGFYPSLAYGQGRVSAQLGVAVDGGKVRVKPPKSSVPVLFAKDSQDGWYELTDVTVDRLSIRGRLKWNRIDRVKLDVDRRTGLATFGSFSGTCQPVSNTPEATKF